MTDNILQEWTLEAQNGGNIQLNFIGFDLENHPSCSYDYVEVSYGSYSERFCGGENGGYLPGPFTTCGGSSITIRFHSDGGVTRPGFRAEWEELATSTPCLPSIVSHADYPNSNYPNNADEVTNSYHQILSLRLRLTIYCRNGH